MGGEGGWGVGGGSSHSIQRTVNVNRKKAPHSIEGSVSKGSTSMTTDTPILLHSNFYSVSARNWEIQKSQQILCAETLTISAVKPNLPLRQLSDISINNSNASFNSLENRKNSHHTFSTHVLSKVTNLYLKLYFNSVSLQLINIA